MGQAGSCGTAGRAAHGGVRTRTAADYEPPKSLAAPLPQGGGGRNVLCSLGLSSLQFLEKLSPYVLLGSVHL